MEKGKIRITCQGATSVALEKLSPTREDFVYAMKAATIVERQYLIWVKPAIVLGHADYQWSHEPCFYAARDGFTPKFYGDRSQPTVWNINGVENGRRAMVLGAGLVISSAAGQTLYIGPKAPKNKKMRHVRLSDAAKLEISIATGSGSAWEISRDTSKGALHPTQKPVGLAETAIHNSSMIGDAVLDSFAGAGAILVACERTGRIGYAADLEPGYVAVTLERMADMGLTPKLVGETPRMGKRGRAGGVKNART